MRGILDLTHRRWLATLLASFALLCAQFGAAPAPRIDHLGPVAVAGHADAVLVRLSTTLTLVKAERTNATAKAGPPLDAMVPLAIDLVLPAGPENLLASLPFAASGSSALFPYRARGPPTPGLPQILSSIS